MTRTLRQFTGGDLLPALRVALAGTETAVFAGTGAAGLPPVVGPAVAVVVQSSGSTARPKRVALSSDALLANAAASESALGGPGQWLLALPTTYIAGINVLVRSIAAATEPVSMAAEGFTVEGFVEAARALDHPLRFTSLVPTQLARLLDAPDALGTLRRFDRILLGGQAATEALVERAIGLGVAVTRSYGSTETSGGCVYDGSAIGSSVLRIVDGEVEVSGPNLAEGYLGDDKLTAAAFHVDQGRRWYRTGDLGSLDGGVLTIAGRRDDLISSGGVKLSLGELERLVQSTTALVDAVVVAVDDEQWGQVPVVISTASMELGELRALAKAALGPGAGRARLAVVESIPMLASGKPDRLALRAALDR